MLEVEKATAAGIQWVPHMLSVFARLIGAVAFSEMNLVIGFIGPTFYLYFL